MEIKFNKENILKSIGIECSCDKYYIAYRHNNNYNNKQYYMINDLKEILDNIEVLKESEED